MGAEKTLVHYFVPEDFDSEEEPNVYFINKRVSEITLADVRSSFPLRGEYLIRFKYRYNKNLVWIDL